MTFALAAFETTFAIMIPQVYGYGATGIGVLLAFAGLMQALAQGYLLGKIVKRIGEVRVLTLGIILLAIGLAPMANLPTPSTLLLALALLSHRLRIREPFHRQPHFEAHASARWRAKRSASTSRRSSMARILGPLAGGLAYGYARNLGALCGWCDCRTHGIYTCARHRRVRWLAAEENNLANIVGWLLIFHLFGVIFWIGSLLLIASLLAMVPDEVGLPKERFIMIASRLFYGGCNIGGAVTLVVRNRADDRRQGRATRGVASRETGTGLYPTSCTPAAASKNRRVERQSFLGHALGVPRHSWSRQPVVTGDPCDGDSEALLAVEICYNADGGTNIGEREAHVMRQGIDETKIPRIEGAKIAILKSRWYPEVVESLADACRTALAKAGAHRCPSTRCPAYSSCRSPRIISFVSSANASMQSSALASS